jgi:hypothetical protein
VMIWNDDKSYSANDSFGVTNVQLEEGGVASGYDQRLRSQEMTLCQDYWRLIGGAGAANAYEYLCPGFAQSSALFYGSLNFYPPMRSTPDLAFSAPSTFICNTSAGAIAPTAIAKGSPSKTGTQVTCIVSGVAAGGGGAIQANNTATAKIMIDAEI